jgi:hypothetical protein
MNHGELFLHSLRYVTQITGASSSEKNPVLADAHSSDSAI